MTVLDAVIALELRLLDPAVRANPAEVERLLDAEFREIAPSGATYVVRGPDGRESLRSSLWRRHADGWRVLFHQGTPVA